MVSFVCSMSRYIYLSSHIWILCEWLKWPFPAVCPFSKALPVSKERFDWRPSGTWFWGKPTSTKGVGINRFRGRRVGVDLAGEFGCLHVTEPLVSIVVWLFFICNVFFLIFCLSSFFYNLYIFCWFGSGCVEPEEWRMSKVQFDSV